LSPMRWGLAGVGNMELRTVDPSSLAGAPADGIDIPCHVAIIAALGVGLVTGWSRPTPAAHVTSPAGMRERVCAQLASSSE
jgi:hypothetical protein